MNEKLTHTRETMTSLAKDMQEYTESDDDLIAMRNSFGQRTLDAQNAVREKMAKRKSRAEELQKIREELGKATAEMGAMEEAKRVNERNLVRREDVVKELARRHGIRGMEVIIDEKEFEEIKSHLLQSLKEEKEQLDKVKVPPLQRFC